MLTKITILVLCLFSAAFAQTLMRTDGGKVKVDFFYESLCPYCQQFMERSLKKAVATPDFWKICEFSLYPYGNARRTANGTSWAFTCQHGTRECEGNLIESCAIKKYDFYTQGLPFILCLEENPNNWTSSGQRCAPKFNMTWSDISACATSEEGIQYVAEMADVTQQLDPPHKYVPWFVVNGIHSSSYENAITADMVKFVCSIYTGSEEIDACKR